MTLPDAAGEEHDPADANARYDEAVEALRALTRDSERFKLLFEENVNYGWRRNCYGLRPVAFIIAALALVATAGVLAFAGGTFASRAGRWVPAFVISVLELVWRAFVVTEGWCAPPPSCTPRSSSRRPYPCDVTQVRAACTRRRPHRALAFATLTALSSR